MPLGVKRAFAIVALVLVCWSASAQATVPERPTSTVIYYASAPEDGGDGRIHVIQPSGKHDRALTSGPGTDTGPSVFPSGRRIVFSSDREGTYDLFSIRADGTGLQRLTDLPGDELFASVSPQAGHISFVEDDGVKPPALHVMDANGDEDIKLASNPGFERATWSPEGGRLVYAGRSRRGDGGLHLIEATLSGGHHSLTKPRHRQTDTAPDIAPNGHHVLFQSDRGSSGRPQIWIAHRDGTRPRRLTRQGSGVRAGRATQPSFSPAGSSIAFTINGNRIAAMDADGSHQRLVTRPIAIASSPDWARRR